MVPFFQSGGGFLRKFTRGFFAQFLASADINKLLGLDFTAPPTQDYPLTAASLAAKLGGGMLSSEIEEIWDFTETSGNFVGEVASTALVPSGANIAHDTVCNGLWNGTDMVSLKGVRFDTNSSTADGLADAGTTIGDVADTETVGIVCVFRIADVPGSNSWIVGKRETATGNEGWQLRLNSTGQLVLLIDGTTGTTTVTIASNHADGAWHCAVVTMNTDSGGSSYNVFSDLGNGTASTAYPGNTTSTNGLMVGNSDGVALDPVTRLQVKYLAVTRGRAMTSTMLSNFWKHGNQNTSPLLDTYTRASLASVHVGQEAGFGVRVGHWASGDFAYGYASAFTHASKLGGLFESSATNLCLHSEDFTNAAWVNTTTTDAANSAEAPDGFKTADTLTATAVNGIVQQAIATAASTKYTQSVYVKRNGGANVTGRLILYNITGSAEIASTAYTATDEWQRVTVTGTTAVGQISTGLRVEIDANTESVFLWGAQMEAGADASTYIRTTTAQATRAKTDARLTNTDGTLYFRADRGEVHSVMSLNVDASATNRYILMGYDGTNNDRVQMFVNTGSRPQTIIYDGAGTIRQNWPSTGAFGDWTTEQDVRIRWDSDNAIAAHAENADVIVDGTRGAGAALAWTTATAPVPLFVGQTNAASSQINGLIATLDVYDAPRADTV